MRCIDFATDRGTHKVNEDLIGWTDQWAWVIDGASPVGAPPIVDRWSDARFLARALDRALREVVSDHPSPSSPSVALRDAIRLVAPKVVVPEGELPPSASVGVIALRSHGLEYVALGDVSVIVWTEGMDPQVAVEGAPSRYEDGSISRVAKLMDDGLSFEEAQDRVFRSIRRHRLKYMNQPDGYWTVSTDPDAVDHAVSGVIDRADEVFLMTDGFRRHDQFYGLASDAGESVEVCRSEGLAAVLDAVRTVELDDPDGTRFKRISISDDATAARFVIG